MQGSMSTPPKSPQDELTPFVPDDDDEPETSEEQQHDDLSAALRDDETTPALVERAQQGDVEALGELFTRYNGLMVETARRRLGAKLRSKEEADDLAQTTFREATRDFQQYEYRGEDSLLRWLMRILNNKIRDKAEYYGARKRDMTRERAIEDRPEESRPGYREPASPDLSVTRVAQRNEEFAILREALEDLSPEHRQAITLVFFQGLTLRKAGEQMGGRSEDAVRMMLRRAESRLRELTKARLKSGK